MDEDLKYNDGTGQLGEVKSRKQTLVLEETTYLTGKYSPCCDELLRVQSSKRDSLGDVDHVTNWYECSKCGKACD